MLRARDRVRRGIEGKSILPVELRVQSFEWPILEWIRYTISLYRLPVPAGTLLRTAPIWTFSMRLTGAKALDGYSTYAGIPERGISTDKGEPARPAAGQR